MARAGEVSSVEVVAWIDRTKRPIEEAVRYFWPGLDADEHRRRYEQVKKWRQRSARRQGRSLTRPPAAPVPPSVPRLPPSAPAAPLPASSASSSSSATEDAELGRVEFLRRQLEQLLHDVHAARVQGDLRAVPPLDKRVAEVRAHLDQAIALERQIVRLDRTATAIAAELEKRTKAIQMRAELERRNLARAASS